jgi:hypothetical protein
MGAILKRVGLGLLALWAVLWVLMTLLLLQDNPPSFRPQDVRNLLIVALAPWAATLLTAVLVRCWNKRLRDIRDSAWTPASRPSTREILGRARRS